MFIGLINALPTCQELFNRIFETVLKDMGIMYFDEIIIYLKIKKIYQIHLVCFPKTTRTQLVN